MRQRAPLGQPEQLLELAGGQLREGRLVELLLFRREGAWPAVGGDAEGEGGVDGDEDARPGEGHPERPLLQRVVAHQPQVTAAQHRPQAEVVRHEEA